jgi:hypothetical protein
MSFAATSSATIFGSNKGTFMPGRGASASGPSKAATAQLAVYYQAQQAAEPTATIALYTQFILNTPSDSFSEISQFKEIAIMKAAQLIKEHQK